jgi:hypothetical protein
LKSRELTQIDQTFLVNDQIKDTLATEIERMDNEDLDKFVEGWTTESLANSYLTVI